MSPDLTDVRLVITSGPTRANIDAVRYITNRSSGRLGRRIAIEALALGAEVTVIAGEGSVVPERSEVGLGEWKRLALRRIETVGDLLQVLRDELSGPEHVDAVVHAMAVLDYVPEQEREDKMRSGRDSLTVRLRPTPKVIGKITQWSPRSVLVGFKLEVDSSEEQLQQAAVSLMRKSGASLVVANDLTRIRDEQHPALIVGTGGRIHARPGTKSEIAGELCSVLGNALR
jgi:phosphopantothenoylcysteine synthetase/decarboxylase